MHLVARGTEMRPNREEMSGPYCNQLEFEVAIGVTGRFVENQAVGRMP